MIDRSARRAHPRPTRRAAIAAMLVLPLLAAMATPADASAHGFKTDKDPYITLGSHLPAGAYTEAIMSVGDQMGDFMFEGIPDGIGIAPGPTGRTMDVYVAHEQTVIPFRNERDFQASSVSKLTINTKPGHGYLNVMDSSVAIGPEAGFQRFCSASIAGPAEGLDTHVFFTGEETSESLDGVQRGFAVVLDTATGQHAAIPGMGRLNHETTVVVPGDWPELAMLTTDDTFSAGTSQLYLYTADNQSELFADEGALWAFQVTGVDGVPLANPADPFNGANDYLDLDVGEDFQGRFIPVPRSVALGDQTVLENWSNANNVMQFVRLEDVAADKRNPHIVYIADTGGSRIQPDPATGRMGRPRNGISMADNGRIFKMVFNTSDPRMVDSLTVLADGDAPSDSPAYVPFRAPDNIDTSRKSLMVQEDASNAHIWQYRFNQDDWRSVATVNDSRGESSGIVDASDWLGPGRWLLVVQAHGTNIDEEQDGDITFKREDGQLLMLRIPHS